jgi:hypothetical protein
MEETPTTAQLNRREFTVQTALAMLSGVVITISEGCGSSSNSGGPDPVGGGGGTTDVNGTVSANHGHVAVITAARLTAMNGFDLDIQGSATHPHTVTLTQAEVTSIAARTQVAKTSSTDSGHNHTVTFN